METDYQWPREVSTNPAGASRNCNEECPRSPLLLAKLSSFRTKFRAQSRVQVAVQIHAGVHIYDAPCLSSVLHTRDDAQACSVTLSLSDPHTHHFVFCDLLPSGRFWCVKGPSSRLLIYGFFFFFFFFLAAVSVCQSQQLHYSFGCCDTLDWCVFSLQWILGDGFTIFQICCRGPTWEKWTEV